MSGRLWFARALACMGLCLVTACSKADGPASMELAATAVPSPKLVAAAIQAAPAAADGAAVGVPAATPRKVVRTAEYELEVEQYAPAARKLEALVAAQSGYVANQEAVRDGDRVRAATFVLRLPAERVDASLRALRELGVVRREQVQALDVTEAYVDLQARLDNAKAAEARLLALLANATGKLDEVLQVERELTRLRGDVEALTGKLKLLSSQVDLATLTVRLVTAELPMVAAAPQSLLGELGEVLVDSTTALRDFALGLVRLGLAMLPWATVSMPFVWLWRRRKARIRQPS